MRWLVVAALCLAACKGKQQSAPKRDDAALQPADAAVPDAALDAALPDAATMSLTITPKGVGPITGDDIEPEDFVAALPGFKVKSQHVDAEDYSYDEITASKDGKQIVRAVVTDAGLFKVVVLDPMFATESGITVGVTVAELVAKIKDTKCAFETYDPEADAERVDRALRCRSASLPHVLFEIDHQKFKGKEGKIGTATIADRTIVEIVWLASES